ncbi:MULTISPECIES: peptidase domain-containing ABC transporter [Chryseobacterium]|uniref:ATP-binding cassette subfamily B protein n=1 Tax=Chryseobacterium camelliae TaxID=1265445 RepID=A0ABU0TKI0_9FLAO|nr:MULTISPECIES: ABC transporter ATP-binding protein [Chryseobacterium]MDT3408639.1 ATP-binding cassette subfamily B protein [Pseudacidovorax intermedius]MDQ1097506.1 ATP-binding cassette subfamily B protein [Chryseobacterium camelliae]MDQ1101435.1 ATP-binding cassette subfamily B protein [Chryseobacterium sp. SORGH_AS_1048]MDR6084879.1 ATP-binding cassette subfamily B protein [Chryseobacterium sp. SORGH_AS_0909]MDR6129230.1 ATP-binding cassette subfamily B protein [Chryseobacterium sp. SORGH_
METTPREQGYKLFRYITKEKKDVTNIYFYAILSGLVQLSVPLGIQSIVSFVMGATMATSIYILIFFVVIGTWLVGFFRLKVMQIIEKIQQKIFVEFSIAFAEKLPRVNLSSTRKYYLPELVNRFFDTQNLQKGISKILLEIPAAIIQILFGILLLSFYHPWFLAFGALVVLSVVLIFNFTLESGIKSSLDESDKKYETASWIEDVAASVKTFKINSETEKHLKGADERVMGYLDHRTSHFKVLVIQYKTIIAFKVIITLAMLVIGTYLLVNQKLNIGAFIATEIVVLSIMAAVEKLIVSLESYYDVIASLAKLTKVTELAEEKNGEIVLAQKDEGIEIEFKDVDFNFNSNVHILQNINFTIRENSITVISGELGSGKSLLLNMMAGFYEPSAGSVLFNKIPLKNINKNKLRSELGVYLEDMRIIQGTVQDNILLGNETSTTEDILYLSEQIGADNISNLFTSGFFTEISETDPEISFSSKKKILLLRALMGNKRLLLLEDPIDGMNETFKHKMLQYLQDIKQRTTVVIVSQNPDIMKHADQHLHMENGTIKSLF